MIQLSYYHPHDRRTRFASQGEMLAYLRQEYGGIKGVRGFYLDPSKTTRLALREKYTCTEHPTREAVGFYTTVDAQYRPTGQVYLCKACGARRGDAWLELGELEHVYVKSAYLHVEFTDGETWTVARVVQGEEALRGLVKHPRVINAQIQGGLTG